MTAPMSNRGTMKRGKARGPLAAHRAPAPHKKQDIPIRAAMGTLRPKIVSGPKNAEIRGKHPQRTPRGTPTRMAMPNPKQTRLRLAKMLRVSARSNHRLGNSRNVSCGLGSLTREKSWLNWETLKLPSCIITRR